MEKLNFGSGRTVKEGFVNVDLHKYPGIAKAFDFEKFPYPFKDDTFDYVETIQVMEHLENTTEILEEFHRIMKSGGRLHIEVPYFRGVSAYAVTHKRFFSVQMIRILTGQVKASSKINQNIFKLRKLRLSFRKAYRILGISFIANKNPKLYEEFLGHIFPATDLIIDLECRK